MFVRTKNIKGKQYAYLVKSINTKKGPRQKIIKYLGLVNFVEDTPPIEADTLKEVIEKLIPDKNKVYKINSGYYFPGIVEYIRKSPRDNVNDGKKMARLFQISGLHVTPQTFVKIFQGPKN